MKITYNKNPLFTTTELDDHEKEILWYKIKVKELEESLSSASIHLDPSHAGWIMNANPRRPQGHTLETLIAEVRKDYLDMDYIYADKDDEKSKLDKRVDELHEHYLAELMSAHCGDCTCVPCSCSKCHAEGYLGIDTIKGLGKHSAYKIDSAFGKDNERSMNDALVHLSEYKLTPPSTPEDIERWNKVGGWEQHVPRWTKEARAAYDWLLNYRNTHFKDQS